VKILVCTDGSDRDQHVLDKAAMIARDCASEEIVVIHVYNQPLDAVVRSDQDAYFVGDEDRERFRKLEAMHREEKKKVLGDALEFFETKNIKATSRFEEGNPAEVICKIADNEKFDLIVIGSRGLKGLQKLLLGSISNAVVQQANASVLLVKKQVNDWGRGGRR